jgi:hypothetical protein
MDRDVDYFFMWTSSFEKALFSSFVQFLIESLILGEFSFLSSLLFWLLIPSDLQLAKIFSILRTTSSI